MTTSLPLRDRLRCPVCQLPLRVEGGAAVCEQSHSFDFARSGYLNLSPTGGKGRTGDSREMVAARAEFLDGGSFEPIAAAVARLAGEMESGAGLVVELGSGTGYYLDAVARALGADGIGIDLSRDAADLAARRHPELGFVVADVHEAVPLLDGCADVAISVFAPRPAAEVGRIVRSGGSLVVGLAGPRHLYSLRERLDLIGIHPDNRERLIEAVSPWFELAEEDLVEFELTLAGHDAGRLLGMGPNARHRLDLSGLGETVTDVASVRVLGFRRGS